MTMTVDVLAAKNAKAKLNYHVLNGKAIRIMWANKNARTHTDKSGNIFIKACPPVHSVFYNAAALTYLQFPDISYICAARAAMLIVLPRFLSIRLYDVPTGVSAVEPGKIHHNARTARHIRRFR